MTTHSLSLFTEHDTYNIHKILGFGCLAHYAYRFYSKMAYGSMFASSSPLIIYATPMVHMSLSLSSSLFHIPKYRFQSKAIIWRELQLHNIIFTSRSVCMMYHAMLFTTNENYKMLYYFSRLAIVIGHHYLADLVSKKYQHKEQTTTRDIPFDTDNLLIQYVPYLPNITKKFYALSQLFATAGLLLSTNPELGYGIMFPIQLSAFLMTLVRKNIISNNGWHLLYSLSLIIPYVLNKNRIITSNQILIPSIFYAISRLICNTDKYINMMWLTSIYTTWIA